MAMAAHPTSSPAEADQTRPPVQPLMDRTAKRRSFACPNLASATTGGIAAASAIFMCTAAAPLALGMMSPERHDQTAFLGEAAFSHGWTDSTAHTLPRRPFFSDKLRTVHPGPDLFSSGVDFSTGGNPFEGVDISECGIDVVPDVDSGLNGLELGGVDADGKGDTDGGGNCDCGDCDCDPDCIIL